MSEAVQQVLDALKGVQDTQAKLETRLDDLQKTNDDFRKSGPWGAPHARRGEDPFTSRGFSYLKAFGLLGNHIDRDNAKVECEVAEKIRKHYDGYGFKKTLPNSVMLPFAGDYITDDAALGAEIKAIVKAGHSNWDPDQLQAVRRQFASMGYTKALSWIDETSGGALVAPPAMGELIEVLRNNEVLMAAGARTLPMPPQGRITFPRQTTAATAYHVGESTNITDSTPGNGDVTLQAKKLTIRVILPNELFHFSAIPIEAFVREDMMKVVALKMDKTLLEDVGSTTTPKGLINYSGITSHTSSDPGTTTNGYRFWPNDPYQMIAKVEEKNATFRAFTMRPLLWATLVNRRADAVAAGDASGPFMFNVWREPGADMSVDRLKVGNLSGYPVYKTTQLAVNRSKGSSTDLTYVLAGDFSDFLIALGGALEFQMSNQGDTVFAQDQTAYRGVMYYDGLPRHEASFVWCDQLYQST